MTMIALLMLALAPEPARSCGTAVVGSYFPTLELKDENGRVIETIKADKGQLPEQLPIVRCSDALILVRWHARLATVDRARARLTQAMVVCPEGATAGSAENSGNAASMGAFDPRCRRRKPAAGARR